MKSCALSLLSAGIACAFISQPASAVEVYKDDKQSAEIKGFFRIKAQHSDDDDEIKDGTSRIGFHFGRELTHDWRAMAVLEWGLDIVEGESGLKVTQGDGLTSNDDRGENIWNRLGYIGVIHDDYGEITMGKRWGVYYEVTYPTDELESFGGEASGTYNFGTDGGLSGTGRAEKALQYRNSWGPFWLGLQYQAKDDSIALDPDDFPDLEATIDKAYSIAATYTTPIGIILGAAYNRADISLSNAGSTADDDIAIAASAKYGTISEPGLYAGLVYAVSENHESDSNGIVYDAKGYEALVQWGFENNVQVYGAVNHLEEDDDDYQGEAELDYYVVGSRYRWTPDFHLAFEIKFEDSTDGDGNSADDIYAFSVKYAF
ncbi:porin [Corallincola platygyrae]|uniref:Porin n=1 Tax=Corallincola platygyrae TaxID=1193278 RepID=A0ABW4XQH3_9GAMM